MSYQKLKSHALAVKEKEYNLKSEEKNADVIPQNEKVHSLVFTVNMDGTISLCENNIPADGPLVTLTKLEDNYSLNNFNRTTTTNSIASDTLPMKQESLKNNIIPDSRKDLHTNGFQTQPRSTTNQRSLLNTSYNNNAKVQNDDNNLAAEASGQMDLPSFLTTMLVELGLLDYKNDNVELVGDTQMFELETGDGNQITIQLEEEEEQGGLKSTVTDNETATISTGTSKQDIVIQQITSRFNNKSDKMFSKASSWCATCHRQFASPSVATRHARAVHAREKPFACRKCGKRFAQKEVMARHELVHDAERPYKCGECPKSFTQRSNLQFHERSHLPRHARPLSLHQCPRCPKVFLYSSGLSRHMSVHQGRVFSCGTCSRQFGDKSALRRHLSVAHPVSDAR